MADQRGGGITWTDKTWNPIRGCSRVSEGCRHCYAETVAARFSGPGLPYEGLAADGKWTGKVRLIPEHLADPLSWKKPRRIFVNSMSDLFHEGLESEEIAAVFGIMVSAPQHTFQVLTKRPERMRDWIEKTSVVDCIEAASARGCKLPDFSCGIWPGAKNIWLGVSVEDQKTADERIPLLLQTPAALRFVSYEPALGPVDLSWHLKETTRHHVCADVGGMIRNRSFYGLMSDDGRALSRDEAEAQLRALRARGVKLIPGNGCDDFDPEKGCRGHRQPRLDWVIVGGESGPKARPFDIAWARQVVRDCKAAAVPCFVKQLGAWPIFEERDLAQLDERRMCSDGTYKFRDRKGGDMAEWPEDLRVRGFPLERHA